jgi:hypothetical protein
VLWCLCRVPGCDDARHPQLRLRAGHPQRLEGVCWQQQCRAQSARLSGRRRSWVLVTAPTAMLLTVRALPSRIICRVGTGGSCGCLVRCRRRCWCQGPCVMHHMFWTAP